MWAAARNHRDVVADFDGRSELLAPPDCAAGGVFDDQGVTVGRDASAGLLFNDPVVESGSALPGGRWCRSRRTAREKQKAPRVNADAAPSVAHDCYGATGRGKVNERVGAGPPE